MSPHLTTDGLCRFVVRCSADGVVAVHEASTLEQKRINDSHHKGAVFGIAVDPQVTRPANQTSLGCRG